MNRVTKEERKRKFKERRRQKAELKLVGVHHSTHYIDSTLTSESIYNNDPQSEKLRKVYPYFSIWIPSSYIKTSNASAIGPR